MPESMTEQFVIISGPDRLELINSMAFTGMVIFVCKRNANAHLEEGKEVYFQCQVNGMEAIGSNGNNWIIKGSFYGPRTEIGWPQDAEAINMVAEYKILDLITPCEGKITLSMD